ncbi:hypothetical protein FN846DRAFT_887306 [Sphaerosporella brunnea]|uniref:Uncharacterized protein n=1 Tax=Sphaerosporella brunnea TaxID=1250544 RepID=A0A5J5F6R4_9PEZI|nr:hypothetical protein FN846DRAFT_887306 [Sphaerosporella brunnea]
MVSFGRPAPAVDLPRPNGAPTPPRRTASTSVETASLTCKTPEDLIIPPPFKRFCLYGFGAQVALDIIAILIVYLLKGAFFSSTIPVACVCLALDGSMLIWTYRATPRPIDVLMKNALSGVAWFMLAVINGAIIADAKGPYCFAVALLTFIVNAVFWIWTVWWGLNDRGPRSMYPHNSSSHPGAGGKRCANCRAGKGGRGIHAPGHAHCPGREIPLRSFRRAEEGVGAKQLPELSLSRRDSLGVSMARHSSFASSCFSEGDMGTASEQDNRAESGAVSPV